MTRIEAAMGSDSGYRDGTSFLMFSVRVELFDSCGLAFAVMDYRCYKLLNTLIDLDSHKNALSVVPRAICKNGRL